jgi:hypothetical protein
MSFPIYVKKEGGIVLGIAYLFGRILAKSVDTKSPNYDLDGK